jgi:hypothetical protein
VTTTHTGRVRDTANTQRSESGKLKNTATVSGRSLNLGGKYRRRKGPPEVAGFR